MDLWYYKLYILWEHLRLADWSNKVLHVDVLRAMYKVF